MSNGNDVPVARNDRLDVPGRDWSIVTVRVVLALLLGCACASAAFAATLVAGTADYRDVVRRLAPGDTLLLRPGTYRSGLDVHRLIGRPGAPIVIRGASGTARSVFPASAGRNTVSIVDSAYVTIADIDLLGPSAVVDAVKAEGTSRFAHDITLEGLHISGHNASQQIVAISTKCPAWDWVIKRNVIVGAGTGLYLGNSDGSAPFVRGLIEGNVVVGSIGYAMQIKHQIGRPALEGMPVEAAETIVRYNTFAKDERSSSGPLARPTVLFGHWPRAGVGATDRYLVYGNLFIDNPSEALLQAEGNLVLYNNVFVNRHGDGVAIREHNDFPRSVDVFHNTIVARGVGLLLRGGDPLYRQTVSGNATFSSQANSLPWFSPNVERSYDEAPTLLRRPEARLVDLDLSPKDDALIDQRWSDAGREVLPDVDRDFDGARRIRPMAGAYAGDAPARSARFRSLVSTLQATDSVKPKGMSE